MSEHCFCWTTHCFILCDGFYENWFLDPAANFCPFQCILRSSKHGVFILATLVVMLKPNLHLVLCCLYCDKT